MPVHVGGGAWEYGQVLCPRLLGVCAVGKGKLGHVEQLYSPALVPFILQMLVLNACADAGPGRAHTAEPLPGREPHWTGPGGLAIILQVCTSLIKHDSLKAWTWWLCQV